MWPLRRSSGSRSPVGFSHQSISPLWSAAAAVAGSWMIMPLDAIEIHDLRARRPDRRAALARLVVGEPLVDDQEPGHALLGVETVRAAADHLGDLLERHRSWPAAPASSRRNWSATCRARPAAAANGLFRRNRMVLSSGADSSSVQPSTSGRTHRACAQRRMLATQSRASTGSPSCHFSPSRSIDPAACRHSRRRGPRPSAAAACNALSMPYSVSNTM